MEKDLNAKRISKTFKGRICQQHHLLSGMQIERFKGNSVDRSGNLSICTEFLSLILLGKTNFFEISSNRIFQTRNSLPETRNGKSKKKGNKFTEAVRHFLGWGNGNWQKKYISAMQRGQKRRRQLLKMKETSYSIHFIAFSFQSGEGVG